MKCRTQAAVRHRLRSLSLARDSRKLTAYKLANTTSRCCHFSRPCSFAAAAAESLATGRQFLSCASLAAAHKSIRTRARITRAINRRSRIRAGTNAPGEKVAPRRRQLFISSAQCVCSSCAPPVVPSRPFSHESRVCLSQRAQRLRANPPLLRAQVATTLHN